MGQKWDKPMQMKKCFVEIKANMFVATTFIEFEFCNPNPTEIEGLYRFELKPGQVITAFQLDLFGKFRDGSIEEKWKATNAYNTIVGKRIDPALLTMESPNRYSLRIYPVPANGCRKVTMTIEQLLNAENGRVQYHLPFNVQEVVTDFTLRINVENSDSIPDTRGLIKSQIFRMNNGQHNLDWHARYLELKNPLIFSIPLPAISFCHNNEQFYALRLKTNVTLNGNIQPGKLAVLWDASGSAKERDLDKEINFLKQYVSFYKIKQLTIVTFNDKIKDIKVFNEPANTFDRWQKYLFNINYDGATQLGCLDLTQINADIFMLFSDGKNTFGRSKPKTGTALLFAIHTSPGANIALLNEITGFNGGRILNLAKMTISYAIRSCGQSENWLMNITSASGKLIVEKNLPMKLKESILIHGTWKQGTDTIYFHYGNGMGIKHVQAVIVKEHKQCNSTAINRLTMLENFDAMIRLKNWEEILDFGLNEKVVTPNTAYIVLERVEDYIKYNIAPPKDLEEECQQMEYVKKDSRLQRKKIKEADDFEILDRVVNSYNASIKKMDADAALINLTRQEFQNFSGDKNQGSFQTNASTTERETFNLSLSNAVSELSEVVVTTAFGIRKSDRSATYSTQMVRSEELNLIPQTNLNQALAGKVAGVQVRGQSAINLNSEGYLRIRGGLSLKDEIPVYVVDGTPVPSFDLNPADIESVTVLKGANATALFGEQAKAGAIVITSKKKNSFYRNYYNQELSYRLKDRPDVDYLYELKKAYKSEKDTVYNVLKKKYADDPGFYMDVAEHYFRSGEESRALSILMNAAEISGGDKNALKAMAYILEGWKRFDLAGTIYQQLIEMNSLDVHAYRDLAWTYYQGKNYQKAVENLYYGILKNTEAKEEWAATLKTAMLMELNAIVAIHKNDIDISFLPVSLLNPVCADLRIVVSANYDHMINLVVKEPGGSISSQNRKISNKRAVLNQNSNWWYFPWAEYNLKIARAGKYRVSLVYWDYYSNSKIPRVFRIMYFKNFGKENQEITIENVTMDNQYGEVEIGEIKWEKKI